jgi:hypothetical protein
MLACLSAFIGSRNELTLESSGFDEMAIAGDFSFHTVAQYPNHAQPVDPELVQARTVFTNGIPVKMKMNCSFCSSQTRLMCVFHLCTL